MGKVTIFKPQEDKMFSNQTTGGGKCNLPNSLTLLLVKFKPATNYLCEAVLSIIGD